MNKLFKRLTGAALGLVLTLGVGSAVASLGNEPVLTEAAASYDFSGDTIVFSEQGLTNSTQYTGKFVSEIFSVQFSGGSNDGKYYNTGSGMRIYGDGKVTVAGENGNVLSKVVFTYGSGYVGEVTYTGYSVSGTVGTWTGSAESISLTRPSGSGHWRLQKVQVTIEESEGAVYDITANITNGTLTAPETVGEGKGANLTLTPNLGYKLPETVTVTGATLTSYDNTTGKIVISNPTSDVVVSATCPAATQYSISTVLDGLTATGATTVYENSTATVTLAVIDTETRALPTTITVTGAVNYEYNSSTGVVTIKGATNDVVITASSIKKPNEVTETLGVAQGNWVEVTEGQNYYQQGNLVKATWTKGTSQSNISYWSPMRVYSGHKMQFDIQTGVGAATTLKKIVIETVSSYTTGTPNATKTVVGGGTVTSSYSGTTATFTCSGTVTSLTLSFSAQTRWNSITVTYDKDDSEVALDNVTAVYTDVLVSQTTLPQLTFTPVGASNKNVSYSVVSGAEFVQLDTTTGEVKGLKAGTATILVTPEDNNADAVEVDVTVVDLPEITTVTVGSEYAITATAASKNYELTGFTTGNPPYGNATEYTTNPTFGTPVTVVAGTYKNTVAFEVEVSGETKYLSYDPTKSGNSLSTSDTLDDASSWAFVTEGKDLVIRNVGTFTRLFAFTYTTNEGVTTGRFSTYQALASNIITPTFVEVSTGGESASDVEAVEAFINTYMHMDHTTNDGSCTSEGWYEAAKLAFAGLTDTQKAIFVSDYEDACARLEAWAIANGETFDTTSYQFTEPNDAGLLTLKVMAEENNVYVIIVVAALVAVSALAIYLVINKRRQNSK